MMRQGLLNSIPRSRWAAILCFGWILISTIGVHGQQLSPALLSALEANRMGTATRGQQALLFQNNNLINQAALRSWIPDSTYQAAQSRYASINQMLARHAAEATGAEFTVQTSKSERFAPGTDSDFIVKTTSRDPVGQIQKMQTYYNDYANSWLEDALKSDGLEFTPRRDWHNRLDVDFMADPKNVTKEQFRQIAELNNDAYTRGNAAEYERVSRAKDGTKVTPEMFSDYAQEMVDFIEKKQHHLERYRNNPSLLSDPTEMAHHQRLMAQEQKYISRIEDANIKLRQQEGLPVNSGKPGPPVYEITTDVDGNAVLRKRSESTIASRGAERSYANRLETIAASAVSDNSTQRALANLADSMAEAAVKNPANWKDAPTRIAELADELPPAAKGQLIDRIRVQHGDDIARQVAGEMRQRVLASRPTTLQKFDSALKSALGVSDELSQLRGLRGELNRQAANAMGGLDKLSKVGTAAELLDAALQAKTITQSLSRALDPNLTDAEADEYFQQAEQAAWSLAKSGMLGALTEAVPTFGVMYAGWSLGFDGTRYILENTETGQRIDRQVQSLFELSQRELDRASDSLVEYFGGKSDRMSKEEHLRDLEASYWRAIREGRIKLKPGAKTLDIARLIREGDLLGIRDLIEPGPNASAELIARMENERWMEQPEKLAAQKPPVDNTKWITTTDYGNTDKWIVEETAKLNKEGLSPFGPAAEQDGDGLPLTDTTSAYRARAQQIVNRQQQSSANSQRDSDRNAQARMIASKIQLREQQAREQQEREIAARQQYQQSLARQQYQQELARQQNQRELAERQYRQQQINDWNYRQQLMQWDARQRAIQLWQQQQIQQQRTPQWQRIPQPAPAQPQWHWKLPPATRGAILV